MKPEVGTVATHRAFATQAMVTAIRGKTLTLQLSTGTVKTMALESFLRHWVIKP